MIVRTCRIDGNQRYRLDKEPAIIVREPDATMQPTPYDIQLMSKHRVLSFKPHRAARSFRQLRQFHHVINSNMVFGTHSHTISFFPVA
jgi:hypothetical protein